MSTPPPDNNYRSYADMSYLVIKDDVIDAPNPPDFDDILKISHCTNVVVKNCWINPSGGNREDGIDIMRESSNVVVEDCIVNAGKLYAFTIKGGSKDITLRDITIATPGGWPQRVDIDIGNFSHTTPNSKTGRVTLEKVRRGDARPVRVRVGWAEKPVIIDSDVKILFWQSLFLKAYVWVKRLFARS